MNTKAITPCELDIRCPATWTAPGQVRTLIKLRLTDWGLVSIADDVCLVSSELVTNAAKSAPNGGIRVRMTRERGAVLLEVWDSSNEMPVTKPVVEPSPVEITADPQALNPGYDDGTGGWGLPIVAALSYQCGVTATPPDGKWTWVRIPC